MNYCEKKELISEKRKLANLVKSYNNQKDYNCMACKLLLKRIVDINNLFQKSN